MRNYLIPLLFISFLFSCRNSQKVDTVSVQTLFEKSEGTETPTYHEVIDYYIDLAKNFPEINIQTIGETDAGYPLHIVTFSSAGNFNFQKIGKDKTVVLINNGIHPGESDGIDATMLLMRDLAIKKIPHPENVIIATIPIYNIGGALNRNSTSRANQNGPVSYGFRGNAQNYDLNRDFIKLDSKNAATFSSIYHLVNPDIFIDTHVSNGADYQYTLTHLFTQHNKLGGALGNYLNGDFIPKVETYLSELEWDITPYVTVYNQSPEIGFSQFMDYPRYSTGYTSLWNTLGMMIETHMLKPYKQRVDGTYALLRTMIAIAEEDHEQIKKLRADTFNYYNELSNYPLTWVLDSTKTKNFTFKGFEVDTLTSEVTGLPRLKYNRDQPYEKEIPFYNHYTPIKSTVIPAAYIIKKGWQEVIDRLDSNEIIYSTLEKDTTLIVEAYKIATYETTAYPYEGHYPHYKTKITKNTKSIRFTEGDVVVNIKQPGVRYLLETLEPEANDSFFNWNFFDPILQQKEGFSPYVFEDAASQILKTNHKLKAEFLKKKETDTVFSANSYAQLDWIFKRSEYYEKAHLQYPVYRILKNSEAAKMLKD